MTVVVLSAMRNYVRARLRRLVPILDIPKLRQWMGSYITCECFRDRNLYPRTDDPAEAVFREWMEVVCEDYEHSSRLHRTTLFIMKNQKWEENLPADFQIDPVTFVEKVVQVVHKLTPGFINISQELFKTVVP